MSYKCEICEKFFSTQTGLDYHSNQVVCLKEKKIYKCDICEKNFDHHATFLRHNTNKTCNSDILKAFKLKNTNLQIL
jgi:DNA-directed RNA polymerase subunit RPC12/RpoP